jgi:hypothetical protein
MNLSILLISILACSLHYASARTSESLKVRIDDGRIIGRWMTSISGKGIRAFMGIPFAAPPVGELRFKAPQRAIPWGKMSLKVQKEPPMCTQTNIFDLTSEPGVMGQEDCLYLNVYTPEVNFAINKTFAINRVTHASSCCCDHCR